MNGEWFTIPADMTLPRLASELAIGPANITAGPVTAQEYESRAERYDGQLREKLGLDPEGMSTDEKRAKLRAFREAQYERLTDAVYKRRGWTDDGVPTIFKLKELGIDFPEVVEVVRPYQEGNG